MSATRAALRLLPRLGLAAFVGGLLYSRFAVPHDVDLPSALDAPRGELDLPGFGALSYYADTAGTGRPLLLVHSVNAAASSYEMRPLFEAFRGERPVYALDLPGFGFSARPKARYTPELYARAIGRMLDHIGAGADVVALSLGAEFAARAALADPRIRSLALISPSGLGRAQGGSQQAADTGRAERLHRLLAFPLWAQALYDLIASEPSILYFLKRSFVGQPDPGLVTYSWPTSHQPGARHAPLHFIAGQLFTPDASGALYAPLTTPTLVLYDQDGFVGFDELAQLVSQNRQVRAQRVAPTRGLMQFERPGAVREALLDFWRQPTQAAPALH